MYMMTELEKLMNAANFDPSKERKDMTLSRLCQEIENGNIVLPIFQTYIRWTTQKCVDLFNYQMKGKAPIAPISINLIDDPNQVIEQISFLDRNILPQESLVGKLSVADGQQRLATNYKAYTNHKDLKRVVLDLKKGLVIELREKDIIKKHQIPVGILYNKDSNMYLNYVNSNTYLKKDVVKDVLNTLRKKNQQYYYVVNFATNMSKDEQMEWFEVLNLAGSQVTESMVYLTDLLVKGIDFYKEYAIPFKNTLLTNGYEDLIPRKSSEVSIPLATLNAALYKVIDKEKTLNSSPIPSDAKPKLIGQRSVEEIRLMFEKTLYALNEVTEFIKLKKTDIPNRIDIITYLVGLFVEKDVKNRDISISQEEYIKKFLSNANFLNNSNKDRRNKYDELLLNYPK